jgi:Tfp pilus assembly protein PilZ
VSTSDEGAGSAHRWIVEFADVDDLTCLVVAAEQRGGIFVPRAAGAARGDACAVVLVHPEDRRQAEVAGVVVWVAEDGSGVGVAFRDAGPALHDALHRLLTPPPSGPVRRPGSARPREPDGAGEPARPCAPDDGGEPARPCEPDDAAPDRAAEPEGGGGRALNVHERLRGLNPNEQMKVAREGEVNERVVLERLYGKAVWEPLLRNPRLTIPEVARLARMGNLPRPQLETIVANPAWLNAPEVRRALLANHRLTGAMVLKVLHATPKAELRLVAKQTIYSGAVRDAALKLLKG